MKKFMQLSKNAKKILSISLKVFTGLVLLFTTIVMIFTIMTVTTVNKNDRSIFGYKFYIVLSDSMSKSENNANLDVHFDAGDIVVIKNVKDPTSLKEGEVIAFVSTNEESYGKTITHMIRSVKYADDGKVIGYVTYGTNKGIDDSALVEPEYVLGVYQTKLPNLRNFYAFLKSTQGYIVCLVLPFVLLIGYNGYNVLVLFRKYKAEQAAIIQTEKEQIEEERRQAAMVKEELELLKSQLAQMKGKEKLEENKNEQFKEN